MFFLEFIAELKIDWRKDIIAYLLSYSIVEILKMQSTQAVS